MMESFGHTPTLPKQPVTDAQIALMDVPSTYQGICKLVPNGKQEYFRHDSPPLVSHSLLSSIKPVGFGGMISNHVAEQKDLPCKRKGMTSTGIITQPLLTVPNKRDSQFMLSSVVPCIRDSDPLTTQTLSMVSSKEVPFFTPPTKKIGQAKICFSKSRADPVTNQSVEPSSKSKAELVDVVRSKLRDSLSASLELFSPTTEILFSDGESSFSKPKRLMAHGNLISSSQSNEHLGADSISIDSSNKKSLKGDDITISDDGGSKLDTLGSCKQNYLDGQWDTFFPGEGNIAVDHHFNIKDDLLQGNGLTWAFDIDRNMEEVSKTQDSIQDEPLVRSNAKFTCSKKLAFEIEMELFKLFGGVTKKYKEKGRSLLFNLKDHNNPDLREKVVFGEVSPKRLCSMTPEELASKELSQWRIAKAEELSQMVVLPDVDMDVRRMVKKTHKGEVQVEVEDDHISVEVSLEGVSQAPRKYGYKTVKSSGDIETIKSDIGDLGNINDISGPHILSDYHAVESDLMLELAVDELKDKESLPPISSIDQLVDFVHFDPLCDLPVDGDMDIMVSNQDQKGKIKPLQDGQCKGKSDDSTDLGSCLPSVPYSSLKKCSGQLIWEGPLQLTVSVVSEFAAIFRRGEMTSGEEWGSSLEVKGRVRMEAFKKFMGELPKSRSRAVMVADFVLKDSSVEDVVSEVVESYVCDERLGFVEPAPGVEIYLFPQKKGMMREILELEEDVVLSPFSQPHPPPSMIGVVVWRRNSQPQQQQQQQCGGSSNSSCTSGRRRGDRQPPSFQPQNHCSHHLLSKPVTSDEDDVDADGEQEDIPPGFGPHDEDLPEFNFAAHPSPRDTANALTLLDSGGSPFPLPPPSAKPMHHMRELVYKYGFSARPLAHQRREYEDDDIPEWQPQLPQSLPPRH